MRSIWVLETVKRLRQEKWILAGLVVLTFGSAALSSAVPILIGKLVDTAVKLGEASEIVKFATGIVGAIVLVELFNALRRYSISTTALRFTRRLRLDVLEKVTEADADFFRKTSKGDIIQRCVDDSQALQNFSLETLPTFLYQMVLAVLAVVAVSLIYWPIGLVALGVYLLYLVPVRYYGERQRQVAKDLTNQEGILKQLFLEKLSSIRLIKTFGGEQLEDKQYREEQRKWVDLTVRRYVNDNVFRNFPRVLDALAPALVYGIGGFQVFQGDLTIGAIVAITRFLPAINAPIKSFTTTFLALRDISVRLERVTEYLHLPQEPGASKILHRVNKLQGEIVFEAVSLETDRGILIRNVSFSIRSGEHVALVGPSGSGKSTLLNLIARMQEPTSGRIVLDQVPLSEINAAALRQRLGVVNQDTFLFNETILYNLRYLSGATRCGVEEMAATLGVDSFIREKKGGYDEKIGGNGSTLSGGQRQRLSIIRTMLKDCDIFLLDEATSALDRENERVVHEAMESLTDGRTCVYVAHRLETVVHAHRILVLERGEIVEEGTHDSLLARGGLYAELWDAQSRQVEEER